MVWAGGGRTVANGAHEGDPRKVHPETLERT